jgi:hypothetical protein
MSRDGNVRAQIKEAVYAFHENEYDWNGVGGLPIRPDVFAMLNWLIPSLCFQDDRLLFRLGVPVITLNDNGTVDWFWEYCHRSLLITFLCAGTVKYGRFFEDDTMEVTGLFAHKALTTINKQLSALIQWTCTGFLEEPEAFTK